MDCIINCNWDDEAQVWVATSENVPGLVLESGSYDALIERVKMAVPELLAINSLPVASKLTVKSEYQKVYA